MGGAKLAFSLFQKDGLTRFQQVPTYGWLMHAMAHVLPNTGKAILIFGCAAILLIPFTGDSLDRNLVRIIVELPLLLILAAVCGIVITLITSVTSAILGGSTIVAALVAGLIGWAIAGGGYKSFGGLGYHELLQPAYALALALPWLLARKSE